MGWAATHITRLKAGETIVCRPRGDSMKGLINSGQRVTISPDITKLKIGDIVLCKVRSYEYLHLIKETKVMDGKTWYLIANNKGHVNGWTTHIYGVVTEIS